MHKLKIKNFGPLREAEISIMPLTIFVGHNNTGKSHCTKLIHSILTSIDDGDPFDLTSFKTLENTNRELFYAFEMNMMQYFDSKPDFSRQAFYYDGDKFDRLFEDGIIKKHLELIENRLKSNFSSDLSMLNGTAGDYFEVGFDELGFYNDSGNLKCSSSLKIYPYASRLGKMHFYDFERKFNSVSVIFDDLNFYNGFTEYDMYALKLYTAIADAYAKQTGNSFYIPSSAQSSVDRFMEIRSDDFFNSNEVPSIENALLSSYLNDKRVVKNRNFYNIACRIEWEVLNGQIRFRKNEDYEDLVFKDYSNGREFDFNFVSASVKQLTPLINYLKYELDAGDTLIIEEIENHLHPANQRALVKCLVNLVNAGLNLILTTHSDYILEQFNNHIRLSNVASNRLDDLGFAKRDILGPEKIAIYNFRNNPSSVSRFDINKTGFIEDTFTEVIEDIHEESLEIVHSKRN